MEARSPTSTVSRSRISPTSRISGSCRSEDSAIGTISRLLDMGANGYLLASSLLGIVAQRLVKKVCSSCAEVYQPDVQQTAWLQGRNINESILFNRGKGCPQCSETGYQGRVGIYELLEITPAMTDALRKNDLQGFNEAVQANEQYQTLSDQVMDYAIKLIGDNVRSFGFHVARDGLAPPVSSFVKEGCHCNCFALSEFNGRCRYSVG